MMAFLATRGFKFDPDRDFKLKRQNLERDSRVGEVIHNHTGRTGAVDGLDRALLARNGLDRQYAHLTHPAIQPRSTMKPKQVRVNTATSVFSNRSLASSDSDTDSDNHYCDGQSHRDDVHCHALGPAPRRATAVACC